MTYIRKYALLILFVLALPVQAIDTFIIEDIQVEGLQRVTPGAVFVVLPVRVGDEMNDLVSSNSIQALFETGYFDDVQLLRDGDTLIVSVVERPTIAVVAFDGNKKLKDEVIENALKVGGLAAGDVYNPELVESFTDELRGAYFEVGHFSAQIIPSVAPLDRNRVELNFVISEGKVALISEIQLVGNNQISDEEILDAITLTNKKTLGILNRNNRYNREQLRADLESISSLYLNQGFIEFSLNSARTFITEDHDRILIVITMTEGVQYKFGELSIASSDEVMPQEELDELVQEPEEEVYSFEEVSNTRNAISDSFANLGYGRAQVDALPTIHDEERKIDVNYVVKPGKLTYVRTITFRGNLSTTDEVLRREMRVLEGGLYTAREIQQSRNRLNRLGIFNRVDMNLVAVPGTDNQVDVVVNVEERLTGSLLFGVGYSETEKASFNFSVSQTNLFGTGRRLALGAEYGDIEQAMNVEYTNPYYTLDGVSRGFTFDYRVRDTLESDTVIIYKIDYLTTGMNFAFPVSEDGIVGMGFDISQENLTLVESERVRTDYRVAESIGTGLETTGGSAGISYRRDTRNRAFFATEGSDFYTGLRASGGDNQYLALTTSYSHYFPIGKKAVLRLSSQVDVASNEVPFYRNYYMSGSEELRGFTSGQIGAKQLCRNVNQPTTPGLTPDTTTLGELRHPESGRLLAKQFSGPTDADEDWWYFACDSARSLGGNVRMINRAELFFPFFGSDEIDDKRIALFIDHGGTFLHTDDSVYNEASTALGTRKKFSFGNMRSSIGVSFEWLSPIGPFGVHYAIPIKQQTGDTTDRFQITLGTFFD